MTILSVNKTREMMGALRSFFVYGRGLRPFLFGYGDVMRIKIRFLAYAALIAALYVALTYLQNFLIPNSASWAIQFRASEALCVLALFTPAAIPGLSIGCLLFNISNAAALPLDFLVGTLATLCSATGMYLLRRVSVKGYPFAAMWMPALFNAFLVGWELSLYIGGGFWLNTLYVAIGEAAVLFSLGSVLYGVIKKHRLDVRLFDC